jgi:magnesium transporter
MEAEEDEFPLVDRLAQASPEDCVKEIQAETLDNTVRALTEIPGRKAAEILEHIGIAYSTEIISHLPPDDAADILPHTEEDFRLRVLKRLSEEQSADIIKLLKYPPETAGGIMTTDFISFPPETTVGDAIEQIREGYQHGETVYYAYILNKDSELLGTVSLKEMTLTDPGRILADIMTTDLKKVPVEMDQEAVAQIFDRERYQALPVVEDGQMKGIVTFDDIIDVIREEATEDVQKIAGGSGNEQIFSKWSYKIRKRLPWLYINLVAAFMAAAVVSQFESTIEEIAILAAFLPVINNQAGNAGMQSLSVTIRGQATGEMDYGRIFRALAKEITTGTVNGLLIGVVIGFITSLWQGNFMLGGVIFLSMAVTILTASVAGFLVPVILDHLNYDPAMASGIFVTAIADISGIIFLLGFATLYLTY